MLRERLTRLLSLFAIGIVLVSQAGCSRESKVQRHLKRADRFFQNQEYLKAEIEYLNVMRLDPRNAAAARQLGLALFEQGRYPQAFAFLQRAKAADPDNVAIRYRLGFGALLARDAAGAREEALFILGKEPANEDALVLLADAADPNELQKSRDLLETYRAQASGVAGFHVAVGLLENRLGNLEAAENSFKEAVRLNPKSATARATLGNFYVRQKRPDQAEEHLKAASASAPPRSLLAMSYADFKVGQGQIEEGKRLLQELAAKVTDFAPVHIRLAELAFAQKKYDECEEVLKRILSGGQVNFEAQFLQGRVRLVKGDVPGAFTEFQRLLIAFTNMPQLHYQIALAHLANQDPSAATISVNEALTLDPTYSEAVLLAADLSIRKADYVVAVQSLSELLKRDTNSVQARVLLARAQGGLKDYAAALEQYQKLAQAYPREPQFLYSIGNLLLLQKRQDAARQAFEHTLSVDREFLPAFEQLIDMDLAAGKKAEASQAVQTRIAEASTNAPLHLLLAKVLLAQQETNKAEQAMLKALELNPELSPAYSMLASLYINTQRQKEALASLETVLQKRTNDFGVMMTVASIYDAQGNFARSRDYYQKVLSIRPNWPPALNNLAYIYSEHFNRPDEALQLAQKARTVLPSDPATADTLGWILYKRGEYERALPLLTESAQALPDHPEALFHLGMNQYALGQEEQARGTFERCLALKGEFAGRAEGEQRLAILTMKVDSTDAEGVRQLEKAFEQRPGDPIVSARLARAYQAKGEHAKAARLYESQLKQNPNSVSTMLTLASLYLKDPNNAPKAMELARKARALAPQDAAVAHALGRLAYSSGDHPWALGLLQESARKLPGDSQVAFDLAQAQFSNGRISDAVATLDKAGSKDAPATEMLRWFRLCISPEDAEKSSAEIQAKLKEQPGHLPAQHLSGILQGKKGDFKAAQTTFESILRQFSAFIPANRELAYIYTEHLGDQEKAFDHAMKAREADRRDAGVAKTLGIITYRRGDFQRSADLLSEALKERGSDPELHFYLGMAQFKLGQRSQSRDTLSKAVALDANARFSSEASKILSELQ